MRGRTVLRDRGLTSRCNPKGQENNVLLDGINHIAWISKDAARLGRFYADVFDADVDPHAPTATTETKR